MTEEEAEVKLYDTIREIKAAGFIVLTPVLLEDGYHLEEVPRLRVMKRDNEPFGNLISLGG